MIFSRSEQTEDLVNGFYGHPAMGAAVFEAVSLTGSYQNSELFRAIQEKIISSSCWSCSPWQREFCTVRPFIRTISRCV